MVFTMNKCRQCGVHVADHSRVCPLCEMVLTEEGEKQSNMYPNIRRKTMFLKKLIRVITFVMVAVQMFLFVVNYYFYEGVMWSVISGASILYLIITLCYTVNRRNGHIRKIFMQVLCAFFLVVAIDVALGYSGWSLEYGVPAEVLLLDGIIIVCMIVNFENWQSYLLLQLFALGVSIIEMILYFTHYVNNPVLPWVSFGVSAVLFSFCVFVGDKTARNELRRRFYI